MPRKLTTISASQRKALRAWFQAQSPRPTQKACIEWFTQTYGHKLSQSTVSDSLSDQYKHLDTYTKPDLVHKRARPPHWEDLEKCLFEWQLQIQQRGGSTSGELLCEKARDIWKSLPQYKDFPEPSFSHGWLCNFKKRWNIKQYNHFGEAGSVPAEAELEMVSIRTIAGTYAEDDIYNMDETGLFWKMVPSRGLATAPQPGMRKDKSRISLVCCTNASGGDRFPLWFIGKHKTPRALRNVNVAGLGGIWRWNKKAWMDSILMKEWLTAFYSHIGTRAVLLTMDNLPAHTTGLQLAPPPPNIRILLLPANSTSRFQPLDQGIIQNLKVYYKKQWLRFLLEMFERQLNPMTQVTVLHAVRWCIRAWNNDILSLTICNCFYKSTLLEKQLPLPVEQPDLSVLYRQVQQAGNIADPMDISNFLNPVEETMSPDEEDTSQLSPDQLLQRIVAGNIMGVDDVDEDDDEDVEIVIPTLAESLQALKLCITYTEHQQETTPAMIRALELLERIWEKKASDSAIQTTLDHWMGGFSTA